MVVYSTATYVITKLRWWLQHSCQHIGTVPSLRVKIGNGRQPFIITCAENELKFHKFEIARHLSTCQSRAKSTNAIFPDELQERCHIYPQNAFLLKITNCPLWKCEYKPSEHACKIFLSALKLCEISSSAKKEYSLPPKHVSPTDSSNFIGYLRWKVIPFSANQDLTPILDTVGINAKLANGYHN